MPTLMSSALTKCNACVKHDKNICQEGQCVICCSGGKSHYWCTGVSACKQGKITVLNKCNNFEGIKWDG